jgi:anti-anti-sigma factor
MRTPTEEPVAQISEFPQFYWSPSVLARYTQLRQSLGENAMNATSRATDSPATTTLGRPFFDIRQHTDPDGTVRLTLIGEIDIAVAHQLTAQLGQLKDSEPRVRLDLSQPQFIDCRGVGAIISALRDARRAGWKLDVDRRVSPAVARIIALAGIASDLWPAEAGAGHAPLLTG